jgi:hypothetical protein
LPAVFALALFISATLLFLVQPLIAKMILPKFGGTPAVWATCMVFFQAVLLAGYAYAHAATAGLGIRRQVVMHVALLLLPFIVLPLSVSAGWAPPGDAHPIPWVLGLLLVTVGLPFFVLSTSAPLLQKWFAQTGHVSARDPYFLYAASNLGSMAALPSYPLLLEPSFRLPVQGWLWTVGYGLFVLSVLACAALVWFAGGEHPQSTGRAKATEPAAEHAPRGTDQTVPNLSKTPPPATAIQTAPSAGGGNGSSVVPWTGDNWQLSWAQRLRWIALAFVPSSLLLGVTTYLTTDIAPIPLLWVIPLALYLFSFILVFSRLPAVVHRIFVLALPAAVLVIVFLMLTGLLAGTIWHTFALHLVAMFIVAMVCHGELARTRPPTRYLTEFYLLMSLGGVLGGMFTALLAPLIFSRLAEYPLALVLACLLAPSSEEDGKSGWGATVDVGLPFVLALLAAVFVLRRMIDGTLDLAPFRQLLAADLHWVIAFGLLGGAAVVYLTLTWFLASRETTAQRALDVLAAAALGILSAGIMLRWPYQEWNLEPFADRLHIDADRLQLIITYGVPVLFCYVFADRPIRFGLCVGAFLLAGSICADLKDDALVYRTRSFFGVLKVEQAAGFHKLVHGTTLHGQQSLDPESRGEALTYFHRTGPIGQVFTELERQGKAPPLGLVGLGTGTLATYSRPGQVLTYYEIDPAVKRIAYDPNYFTFLTDAEERGVKLQVVLGDARLQMARTDDPLYGLIVVDAFSSDAIPIHLLTREAIELYLDHLTADGLLVFHISNRYINLEPVLANLAKEFGLVGLAQIDEDLSIPEKAASHWVVLARKHAALGGLATDHRWQPIKENPAVGLWTDDYSNLLSVIDWGK